MASFSGFGIRVMLASSTEFQSVSTSFFGKFWKGLVLILLWMFGRIYQWSHLVLDSFVGIYLITNSISSWFVQILLLGFKSSLYVLYRYKFFIKYVTYKYFLQSMAPISIFFTVNAFFKEQTFLSWWSPVDWFFSFMYCDFSVISKKYLPNPRSQRFSPMFSCKSCIILGFTIRSTIHFELTFV